MTWKVSQARAAGRRILPGLLILTALPAAAQEHPTPLPLEVPLIAPTGTESLPIPTGDVLELTLEEAVALALERNLDLRVSRNSYLQSSEAVRGARGVFDLDLSAGIDRAQNSTPTVGELEGAAVLETETDGANLGLGQLTPWGGRAGLDWSATRSETNSIFSTLNPSYRSGVTLGYSQPLLRGFGPTVTRYEILVAQRDQEIQRSAFQSQVIGTVQRVADAYWQLVEARQQLGVAEEALALAEQLHSQNQVRVDVGTLAPLELVQSEAGVATQREVIIRAQAAVGNAADQLRLLLNFDQGPLWTVELIPTTAPASEQPDVDVEAALGAALDRRPELDAQVAENERAALAVVLARSLRRPRLDLDLAYTLNGAGGDILERDPVTGEVLSIVPGGLGDALDQISGLDFDGWRVGLQLGVPLQNRAARARLASAELALDSVATRQTALHQQIALEVRTAARNLESAWQQVESARASRHLQERSLDAEQKRFDNGMSTSFQVLQVQNELTAARSREVAATVGYDRARIEYHRAVGDLLERLSVRVVEAPGAD